MADIGSAAGGKHKQSGCAKDIQFSARPEEASEAIRVQEDRGTLLSTPILSTVPTGEKDDFMYCMYCMYVCMYVCDAL